MDYETRVAEAMKKVLLGHLISEMGLNQLPIPFDQKITNYLLDAGKAIKGLQNLYTRHPTQGKLFEQNFTANKNVLIAEILGTLYPLHEDYLEDILESLKRNIDDNND